jgi:3-phosphoglycerate kinase
MAVIIKTKEEIEILREGGKRLASILARVAKKVAPGVTTKELDEYAYKLIKEGGKKNNPDFAKKLAQMADIYVNDAFSVSHREHASLVGVPKYLPHYGGLVLKQEIENISKAFSPVSPFVFILGGAKFSTKLPLIEKYLKTADTVFVGGALANDLFKDMGYEVGTSLVFSDDVDLSNIAKNPKTKTFVDVTVTRGDEVLFKDANQVSKDECIVDAGPKTVEELKNIISGAKTIVWNGPLGNYEKGFSDKTEQLAEIIAEETEKGAVSIIGGGDTVASIQKLAVCGGVPQDMNISGKEDGSYLLIQFCLDCGQMQGKWPVGKTAYENT